MRYVIYDVETFSTVSVRDVGAHIYASREHRGLVRLVLHRRRRRVRVALHLEICGSDFAGDPRRRGLS